MSLRVRVRVYLPSFLPKVSGDLGSAPLNSLRLLATVVESPTASWYVSLLMLILLAPAETSPGEAVQSKPQEINPARAEPANRSRQQSAAALERCMRFIKA